MLFETLDPASCGIVDLDQSGVVKSFYEKVPSPPGNLANAAVYILEPAVLGFLDGVGKREIDFSTEVIPHFMGQIATYLNDVYHRDIGTLSSWEEAQKDFPIFHNNGRKLPPFESS
jgi:mannose-1-phosphate guanylyltransferase